MSDYSHIFETNQKGQKVLPNIKKIFLPDPGMEIMDADLSGADAYTYFADSECKKGLDFLANPFKFHSSGKLYAWVASEHLQRDVSIDDPEYKLYKGSHHGDWYGMMINKMALTINCSYSKAKDLHDFYNYIYPEKQIWQERLLREVNRKGYISNIFGRRAWFLNKNDLTRPNKIFSFKPQSTTADVINRGWVNICNNPYLQNIVKTYVSLQVHDSLVIQYPIEFAEMVRPLIKKNMEIELPYSPPIVIPADFKISRKSYGDAKKISKFIEECKL